MTLVRRATVLAAFSIFMAAVGIAGTVRTAQAATITGAGTTVKFSGYGGDYVTGDQPWAYDPSNSTINASLSSDSNHVSIQINGNTFWDLDFAAPSGEALTAGTVYDNAARYPFQAPSQPGLSLVGDGRGCNTVTGSFTVKRVLFGRNGWIQSFDATFVQHCEGDPNSGATGEVVLKNGPAPQDLHVSVASAAIDHVSQVSGQVTLRGTITCNRLVAVTLGGTLAQKLNRTTLATGSWSVSSTACGPTPTQWTATVAPNGSIPFDQGSAQIEGTYSSFDPIFQLNVTGTFSKVIKLGRL